MAIIFVLSALAVLLLATWQGWIKATQGEHLSARPVYYAAYFLLNSLLPMLLMASFWLIAESFIYKPIVLSVFADKQGIVEQADINFLEVKQVVSGFIEQTDRAVLNKAVLAYQEAQAITNKVLSLLVVMIGLIFFKISLRQFSKGFNAREKVEKTIKMMLAACSAVAVLTTLGIVLSLLFETLSFFKQVPFFDFILGTHWSPQTALRADQAGSSGSFGLLPLLSGTLLIAFIAMLIAIPVGLYSAIYLAEYATVNTRKIMKPALEILAGIPTVVYGFFAALTVAPFIVGVSETLGLEASSENALAAGIVMGAMIIPFISSLSEDVISAVPQALRDASLALGSTKAETIKKVVLPAALPGIVSAVLLGFSRAVGETMIVVMAAGLAANMTANPLESVTTITAQIVTILVGDQSFDSPKTLAAFALGLTLFTVTLLLNIIALRIVHKYKEQYE